MCNRLAMLPGIMCQTGSEGGNRTKVWPRKKFVSSGTTLYVEREKRKEELEKGNSFLGMIVYIFIHSPPSHTGKALA